GGRDTQGHLVLFKRDHEHLELEAGDLLLFDGHDPADAVGRIDHEIVGAELVLLGLRHLASFQIAPRMAQKDPWGVALPRSLWLLSVSRMGRHPGALRLASVHDPAGAT